MSEEERILKPLKQLLQEKEYSITGGIIEAVKEWLTQYQNERTRESERSEGAYLQLEELLKELENNPKEEGKTK